MSAIIPTVADNTRLLCHDLKVIFDWPNQRPLQRFLRSRAQLLQPWFIVQLSSCPNFHLVDHRTALLMPPFHSSSLVLSRGFSSLLPIATQAQMSTMGTSGDVYICSRPSNCLQFFLFSLLSHANHTGYDFSLVSLANFFSISSVNIPKDEGHKT